MKARKANAKVSACVLIAAGILGFSLIAIAGSLEPSELPGPTMKTLAEIDPGILITSVPYIISEPGTYYLAEHILSSRSVSSGITIWADNVTLDLKGFSLASNGVGVRHAIFIDGAHTNITIRNGTITHWGGNGIHGAGATMCRVENLQALSNDGSGIYLPGGAHVVTGCVASENGDDAPGTVSGIYVGNGSRVTDNTANGNGTNADGDVYGIHVGRGSTVEGNTVSDNGYSGDGNFVYGIKTGMGCTVRGNTSNNNGDLTNPGSAYGIYLGVSNLVDQNTAADNASFAASGGNMTHGVSGCVYGVNVAP